MDYEEMISMEHAWSWVTLLLSGWLVAAVLSCLLFAFASGPDQMEDE